MAKLGAEDQSQAEPEKHLLLFSDCTQLGTIKLCTKEDVPQRVVLHEKALLLIR